MPDVIGNGVKLTVVSRKGKVESVLVGLGELGRGTPLQKRSPTAVRQCACRLASPISGPRYIGFLTHSPPRLLRATLTYTGLHLRQTPGLS